jgi:hypothetical protein
MAATAKRMDAPLGGKQWFWLLKLRTVPRMCRAPATRAKATAEKTRSE